jgi:hypothetical protein
MKSIKEQLIDGNLLNTYQYLFDMHNEKYPDHNKVVETSINECVTSYSKTVNELIEFIEIADVENQDTVIIRLEEDFFDKEKYICVSILSSKYVEEPPADKKSWGGNEEDKDDCPEGHYNINWYGYQKMYAMSGMQREKLLLNDVIVGDDVYEFLKNKGISEENYDDYLFAEFLFELTFQGYVQRRSEEFWNEMKDRSESETEQDYIEYETLKKSLTKMVDDD